MISLGDRGGRHAVTSGRQPEARILIINVLPSALHHYVACLEGLLGDTGATVDVVDLSIEGLGPHQRVQAVLRLVGEYWKSREYARAVVCWPALGYLEPILARLLRGRRQTSVVIHDYPPLRRQFFTGRLAQRVGVATVRHPSSRIEILAHSREVAARLKRSGWCNVQYLPHPFRARPGSRLRPRSGPVRITVAGQFKPSRALDLLKDLAARPEVDLRIVGRGWPRVGGAAQVDRWLTEEQLDSELLEADVVLIPYDQYSQSGILYRAASLAVPIVGVRHEQIVELWGTDYPGMVDCLVPDAVLLATEGARESRKRAAVIAMELERRTAGAWSDWVVLGRPSQ